jgi:uncharacterized membrane protein (GlpM family)
MAIGMLALKALIGGVFVVLFASIGGALKPKRFAGLFAAAPAVALASLLLTTVTRGSSAALPLTTGMVIGSVGMIAYCAVALYTVERFHATIGSISAWAAWFVAAGGLYLVFER